MICHYFLLFVMFCRAKIGRFSQTFAKICSIFVRDIASCICLFRAIHVCHAFFVYMRLRIASVLCIIEAHFINNNNGTDSFCAKQKNSCQYWHSEFSLFGKSQTEFVSSIVIHLTVSNDAIEFDAIVVVCTGQLKSIEIECHALVGADGSHYVKR